MKRSVRLKSIFKDEEAQGTTDTPPYYPSLRIANTVQEPEPPLDSIQRSDIIKYLSDNLFRLLQDDFTSESILKVFETLIVDSALGIKDKDLLAVLRNNGWNGAEFHLTNTVPFDPNALLLACLNLHLRSTDKDHQTRRQSLEHKSFRKQSIMATDNKIDKESVHITADEIVATSKDFYFDQVRGTCHHVPSFLSSFLLLVLINLFQVDSHPLFSSVLW